MTCLTGGLLLEFDDDSDTIKFIHASAADYFNRSGESRSLIRTEYLSFAADTRNNYCSAVYSSYLAQRDIRFVREDIDPRRYDDDLLNHLKQCPFLEYCALNLVEALA